MNTEKIQLSKDAVTAQLEEFSFNLHQISYLNGSDIKDIKKEYISVFGLTIVTDGDLCIDVMRTKYKLNKGACVIYAPGSLFDLKVSEDNNSKLITINFDFERPIEMEKFKLMLGLKDNLVYDKVLSNSTLHTAEASFDIVQQRKAGCYIFAKLALLRIISTLVFSDRVDPLVAVTRSEKSDNEEAMVLKCHSYVINRPEVNVTVEEICDEFLVSQSYIYKCFKNVMGMSTKEFITLTKIRMTETDLLRSNKSIGEIAVSNGYANSYQYSNIFKRVHGISPSAYRKRHKM